MKISVIMQSFLGDYDGSRKDSHFKLERAIKSFQNQTDKNNELILISDNCLNTKKIWKEKFSEDSRIKFFHLEDNSKKMYQKSEEGIFYRGYPRQVGIGLSKFDVITYMDSDDFILPNYLEKLSYYWSLNKDYFWFLNNCWYENSAILEKKPNGYHDYFEEFTTNSVSINNLESNWILSKIRTGKMIMSPALVSHRKKDSPEWSDYIRKSENDFSEDMIFIEKLTKFKGARISLPGYVRCHLKDFWDY